LTTAKKASNVEVMRKITLLLVCYMLAVVLCVSGIVLNYGTVSASGGSGGGAGRNGTLDTILWAAIGVMTVAVIVASAMIAVRSRRIICAKAQIVDAVRIAEDNFARTGKRLDGKKVLNELREKNNA